MGGNKSDNNLLSVFAYYINKELNKNNEARNNGEQWQTNQKQPLDVTHA